MVALRCVRCGRFGKIRGLRNPFNLFLSCGNLFSKICRLKSLPPTEPNWTSASPARTVLFFRGINFPCEPKKTSVNVSTSDRAVSPPTRQILCFVKSVSSSFKNGARNSCVACSRLKARFKRAECGKIPLHKKSDQLRAKSRYAICRGVSHFVR